MKYILWIILLCFIYSPAYPYFELGENNGDWEFSENTDPFNDKTILKMCINSNDRNKGYDHEGSSSILCITYNKEDNMGCLYLKTLAYPFNATTNPVQATLRFGDVKPVTAMLKSERTDDGSIQILTKDLSIIKQFFDIEKLAIKIKQDKYEKTYIFDFNPTTSKKIGKEIYDLINY